MKLTVALLQNSLTTAFGILAGLPLIVAGSGLVLNPEYAKWLTIIGGVGIIGLGVVSKAFNTHSTQMQVIASTATVTGNPLAPTMVRLADEQIQNAIPVKKETP